MRRRIRQGRGAAQCRENAWRHRAHPGRRFDETPPIFWVRHQGWAGTTDSVPLAQQQHSPAATACGQLQRAVVGAGDPRSAHEWWSAVRRWQAPRCRSPARLLQALRPAGRQPDRRLHCAQPAAARAAQTESRSVRLSRLLPGQYPRCFAPGCARLEPQGTAAQWRASASRGACEATGDRRRLPRVESCPPKSPVRIPTRPARRRNEVTHQGGGSRREL